MSGGERAGIEPAEMRSPADFAANKASAFQHLDMFRGGGERHGIRFGQLPDRALALRQLLQHMATGGVAQSVENGVDLM